MEVYKEGAGGPKKTSAIKPPGLYEHNDIYIVGLDALLQVDFGGRVSRGQVFGRFEGRLQFKLTETIF